MSDTNTLTVINPETGEKAEIATPQNHDGSRIKVEFENGAIAYTEGFDPAERALAGERPVVPCGECGAPQVLTQRQWTCSACGAENTIELRVDGDSGSAAANEG